MSRGFSLDAKIRIRKWANDDLIRQHLLKSEGSPLNRNSDDWGAVLRDLQRALPNEDLKDVKRLKRRINFEKSAIRKSRKALLNAQPSSTTPTVSASPQPPTTPTVSSSPQPSTSTQPTTQPTISVIHPMTSNDDINLHFGFNLIDYINSS